MTSAVLIGFVVMLALSLILGAGSLIGGFAGDFIAGYITGGTSRWAVARFLAALLGAIVVGVVLAIVTSLPATPVMDGIVGFLGSYLSPSTSWIR